MQNVTFNINCIDLQISITVCGSW